MKWLKDKIESLDVVRGLWLASGSHVVAEVAAATGFDWVLVDMEHGLGDESDVLHILQALAAATVTPVVRVPNATSDAIKRVLDFGASGVMAPMIDNADQAAVFARALRYPPHGTRGLTQSSRAADYGLAFDDYFAVANRRVAAIVQIETAAGVEQADAIAATDGVDALFIGHSDLALSLGCPGNWGAPALVAAEQRVLQACARHGKTAGMLLKSGMSVDECRAKGFALLALGTDIGCLKQGFARLLS